MIETNVVDVIKEYRDTLKETLEQKSGHVPGVGKKINRLQREIDFLISELRHDAPPNSTWGKALRESGCKCKDKAK